MKQVRFVLVLPGRTCAFLQLQNDLMPVYNSIFLKNGLDINDKKLLELAGQMGGTPTEIWESRE